MAARRRVTGSTLRRLLRNVILVLIFLPLVLTLLYSVVPPISTLMLARYVTGQKVERDWQPLDRISPHLIRSVITSEDSGFCTNDGVEWSALTSQLQVLSDGDTPRGASTLTMQVAKNLFLWGDRSYVRKAVELPLALMLDAVLTKRRVLEIYLNIAEWGDGIFGAEAAAQYWFHESAIELTPVEAARLATALPNPHVRNPRNPKSGHRHLAYINLTRVKAAGPIFDCVLKAR